MAEPCHIGARMPSDTARLLPPRIGRALLSAEALHSGPARIPPSAMRRWIPTQQRRRAGGGPAATAAAAEPAAPAAQPAAKRSVAAAAVLEAVVANAATRQGSPAAEALVAMGWHAAAVAEATGGGRKYVSPNSMENGLVRPCPPVGD